MEHLLSGLIAVPIAGAIGLLFFPRQAVNTIRTVSVVVMLVELVLSIRLLEGDFSSAGFVFLEQVPWVESLGISYKVGLDGISLWLVLLTTLLTPIALYASWLGVKTKIKEFAVAFLLLEAAMIGDVRRARPVPLLRVLGAHARADVPDHRRLGRPAARVRGREVLPLHDGRQRADAGRHPVRRRRLQEPRRDLHVRSRRAAASRPSVRHAALALRRFRARVRDQGPDVPVPHVVARRARRGADGRLRDSRRGAPQARDIRVHPLRDAALSARRPLPRADDRGRGHRRHPLRGVLRLGAARREEARRVQLREPPRVRDARPLLDERRRYLGRHPPDGEPRRVDGRALPTRRRHLRAAPHARARRRSAVSRSRCRSTRRSSSSSR